MNRDGEYLIVIVCIIVACVIVLLLAQSLLKATMHAVDTQNQRMDQLYEMMDDAIPAGGTIND